MRVQERSTTRRITAGKGSLVAPILVCVLLVISLTSLIVHQQTKDTAAARTETAEIYRLYQLRATMGWIHFDVLNTALVDAANGDDPADELLTAFTSQRADIIAELQTMALDDGTVGRAAEDLLFEYTDVYANGWPFPATALNADHYISVAADVGATHWAHDPELTNTIFDSIVIRLVLSDAVTLVLDERPAGPPAWADEYSAVTVDLLRSAPGWMGPDREDPLADNAIAEPRSNRSPSPELDLLQQVWDYDEWLIQSMEEDRAGPPPLTVDELAQVVDSATAGLDRAVLDRIDQLTAENNTTGPIDRLNLPLLAALSGASAIIGAVALLVGRHLRHQSLTDAVYTDSLTGARNRRYLSEELTGSCRRRNSHHVVAMIDLDRFKIVNDSFGHDAGDALLVTTAQRLDSAVQQLTSPWPEADGAVVRLGGDEFAVILHSPDRFNMPVVEAALRSVAGPVDVNGTSINLELSVGLAESFEPIDVNELLKGADLAVYRDKRSEDREDRDGDGSHDGGRDGKRNGDATGDLPPVSVDLRWPASPDWRW